MQNKDISNWLVLINRTDLGMAYAGGNLHTSAVVRSSSALHESWDLIELAADLLHHRQGSLAHALHGHGAEPVRKHGTNQESSEYLHSISGLGRPPWTVWVINHAGALQGGKLGAEFSGEL